MSHVLVLVAHDGKTLQLEASGQTRVDAVQQALVSVTGIALGDQIVMCHGARLDPAKPLAAYKLPVADAAAAEDSPLFLYHKAFLRPGAPPPPQEPLPMLEVTVPSLPQLGLRHPLHAAHSPLIRALPDYEAQFTQQLGEARAYWEASQQRLHRCRQLMSEQEVQARAADAARANVESHYNYIATLYAAFVDKYVAQHRQHSALLAQFGDLSAALSSVALPQQLVTAQWRVLADLQPRVKLAEWHESCSRSHDHFAQKVVELEGVFQLLRGDVERLFMQAPRVDLDALGNQLEEAEGLAEQQAASVQVLASDLATVRSLVESVVAQLGSSAGGASLSGAAVHDSCAAVDSLLETHLHDLLPRVRAGDASIAEFLLRCGEAKACMTRDVLEQLQGIAAQQSRIRDMKHSLGLLAEVLARQAAAFGELQAANRLPAAYRLALAECARRGAWREMYAAQASRLADHCGRITAKEAAKRDAVNRQLERHLPHDLLAAAGLLQEPPHCTVSLPPSDAFLLPVSPADVARLPAAIQAAADAAAAAAAAAQREGGAGGSGSSMLRRRSGSTDGTATGAAAPHSSSIAPPPGAGAASMAASTAVWAQRADGAASVAVLPAMPGAGAGPSDPALENARLRAELAAVLAQQAAKELGDSLAGGVTPGAGASTHPGGASQLLGGSVMPAAADSVALAASAAPPPAPPAAAAVPPARPYGHGGPAVVPPSVAAPLPSVSAALTQAAEEAAQAAAAGAAAASQQALALGPVQAALAAKDGVIGALESRCSRLSSELASYESRISQLEAQLAAATPSGAGLAAAATAAGGSATQQRRRSSSGIGGAQAPTAAQAPKQPPATVPRATSPSAAVASTPAIAAGCQPVVPAASAAVATQEPADDVPVAEQQQQRHEQRAGDGSSGSQGGPQPPQHAQSEAAAAQQETAVADASAATAVSSQPQQAAQVAAAPEGDAPAPAIEPCAAVRHSAPAAPGPLSVSEPDLRGVLVAGPAEVALEQSSSSEPRSSRPHRASLDGSAGAAAAAAAGAGGLTGLLSSSMRLFTRVSSTGGNSTGSPTPSPLPPSSP